MLQMFIYRHSIDIPNRVGHFEGEIAFEALERHKSSGTNRISAELIQARDKIIRPVIHDHNRVFEM
jgi:hypothetical protein